VIRVRKSPDAYFITINNRTLREVGKDGMIKDELVARRLRDAVRVVCKAEGRPEADVTLFAGYTLTGA